MSNTSDREILQIFLSILFAAATSYLLTMIATIPQIGGFLWFFLSIIIIGGIVGGIVGANLVLFINSGITPFQLGWETYLYSFQQIEGLFLYVSILVSAFVGWNLANYWK